MNNSLICRILGHGKLKPTIPKPKGADEFYANCWRCGEKVSWDDYKAWAKG